MNHLPLRERLYKIIFEYDSAAGRRFDTSLFVLILASLAVVLVDSVESYRQRFGTALTLLEWGFTLIFAVEYLTRLYCSPKRLRYAFSFFGLIDLLAVLPSLLALFFPASQYLMVVRILRLLRIFRVLKLRQYLIQANFLLTALRNSRQKITVFFVSIASLVVVFGAVMYVIEGPANGFTSIPQSIYWAIVTLTTVGFGDITPKTPLGQAVASLVMITGYAVIAVPTGIFTAELSNAMRNDGVLKQPCPCCPKAEHEANASFCSRCGSALFTRPPI